MSTAAYIKLSGIIFSIVCLIQVVRASMKWPVRIGSRDIPVWPSWIAAIVTGFLAYSAFSL